MNFNEFLQEVYGYTPTNKKSTLTGRTTKSEEYDASEELDDDEDDENVDSKDKDKQTKK